MSGIFGAPKAPAVMAPAPMPDPQSPAVLEAQRKAGSNAMARTGRASTVLGVQGKGNPAQPNPVGGDSYAGSRLGGM